MQKDCIFLLADTQMESAFKGFLGRKNFHKSLGIRPFNSDIIVDVQNADSGLYKRAHQFLSLYHRSHQHAIVVLDNAWQGSPGPNRIRETIKENLMKNGWREDTIVVVVIEPELEAWLWQDSIHIVRAFQLDPSSYPSIKAYMQSEGLWLPDASKPGDPKRAFEVLSRKNGIPPSGSTYNYITSRVSVNKCIDPAFCQLRETLQRWFPLDGDEQ